MKPNSIDHIVIVVKDIAKTEKFYSQFLGKPKHLGDDSVSYDVGGTQIFFGLPYKDYQAHDKDKYGLNHLAFRASSLDELKEFEKILNSTGVKNSGIQIDKYGSKEFIWFDDPDGYRLEFYLR